MPQAIELRAVIEFADVRDRPSQADDNIDARQIGLVESERITNTPFYIVTGHGLFTPSFRDDDAEPGVRQGICATAPVKRPADTTLAGSENTNELVGID